MELLAIGSLDIAPNSPLTVTTTSSDPAKVLLLPLAVDAAGTTAGSASFQSVVAAGKGTIPTGGLPGFWIQALASTGTVNITVSAPGYNPATATVTLTPSGFVLNGPAGTGANFTATLGADKPLTVSPVQLDGSGNVLSSSQKLRGGAAGFVVNVSVTSGTTTIGTILGNPAVVQPGSTISGAVNFHPLAGGTTLLSVTQPDGFSAPAIGSNMTATVTSPTITLNPVTVGFNQQTLGVGQVNQAPTSTLSVTISSSDATKVLLSTDPTVVGSGSITLSVAAGTTALPAFYVQAAGPAGSAATMTATATNYSSGTANIAVSGSAFIFLDSSGSPLTNFTTTTISSSTNLTVGFWQLDSLSRPSLQGVLRPGQSASVGVTSGTPSTGTIINGPASFSAGDSTNTSLSFQPQANCTTPCTTVLSIAQPAGYSAPASSGQVMATVNKPTVTLLAPTPTIGQNLEVLASGSMDATYSADLAVTVSSGNPNVLFSSDPTTQGTTSLTVIVPTGSGMNGTFPNYYVQALAASGTATLTATVTRVSDGQPAGFNVTPVTVTLAPAGFVLDGGNGAGGTIAMSNNTSANLNVIAVVLNPNTLAPTTVEEPVRGGFPASVAVASGGPAATITGTPVGIGGGFSRSTVTVNAVSQSPGVVVAITPIPSGFSPPSSGSQLAVVIN